jgi:hypothetical protein
MVNFLVTRKSENTFAGQWTATSRAKGYRAITPEIKALPFDELRTLHREIGALIAQRRPKALEQLKQQIAMLAFSPDDLAAPKSKRGKL